MHRLFMLSTSQTRGVDFALLFRHANPRFHMSFNPFSGGVPPRHHVFDRKPPRASLPPFVCTWSCPSIFLLAWPWLEVGFFLRRPISQV